MPQYIYRTESIMTGEVLAEIEMYGVFCDRFLNRAGNFQGTYRLMPERPGANAGFLSGTDPGKAALFVNRDGEDVWGGIIWARTYAAQGQTIQINANTWESYFDHMVFYKDHFIQQKIVQEDIFEAIVTQLQGQNPEDDIGLTIQELPTTGYKRTVLIPNYEYHFGADAMNQVVGVNLGLEYNIHPDKKIYVAQGGELNADMDAAVYDFPGTLQNYWYPESGAQGAVKMATLGAGDGNKVLRAVTRDDRLIDDGYPGWWKVSQYSDIYDISIIQGKNADDFVKYRIPYSTPTFEVRAGLAKFDRWNALGSPFSVFVEDVRYPNGKLIDSRMTGWELTPAEGDTSEVIRFVLDGSEIDA